MTQEPTLRLICQESSVTGLPQLLDPAGRLGSEALAAAQREIAGRYERLVSQGGSTATIKAFAERGLPAEWRVTASFEPGRRCPTLIFEPADPNCAFALPSASDEPKSNGGRRETLRSNWRTAWLEEVQRQCRAKSRSNDEWRRLDGLFSEIAALAQDKPRELAMILLAGYVRTGEALSRQSGAQEAQHYRDAAATLAVLCQGLLPPGAFVSPQNANGNEGAEPHANGSASKKTWLARLLGR